MGSELFTTVLSGGVAMDAVYDAWKGSSHDWVSTHIRGATGASAAYE